LRRWWRNEVIMKSLFDGSVPNKRKKIFALDGSDRGSRVFSFRKFRRPMSQFEFNAEERNFPIFGAEYRNIPTAPPINYRLWIVEIIYVYSIGKEMILDEYKDQKVFRTAYRQWVAAKEEQSLVTFHEAGFFRDLHWKKINHDKMNEKPIDG
jgi:hypothetical protein